MKKSVTFGFDLTIPLLPQVRGLVEENRKRGNEFDSIFLLPENYLRVLQEIKELHGIPKMPNGHVYVISDIAGCDVEMGMPG